jgi:hypothetical protein
MNYQPHDAARKAQARTIYEAKGSRAAADQTGLPRRTVNAWAKQDGWQRPLAAKQPGNQRFRVVASVGQAGGDQAKRVGPGWQPQRVLDRLAWELWAELDTLAGYREARKPREARDSAVQVGILVDKAMALAKQAGLEHGGQHDPETAVGRLHEMLDALQERATGGR